MERSTFGEGAVAACPRTGTVLGRSHSSRWSASLLAPPARAFVATLVATVSLTVGGRAAAAQVAGGPASAARPERVRIQPPWRFSVRADNDAFNYWQPITDRPDKEYTNGDLMTLELAHAPWWGTRFARHARPCTGEEEAGERCLMTSFALGQDMYTPAPGREPGRVPDWRDDRPYAAWLYTTTTARVLSERSLRTVSLSLGVTGPPALGEFSQKTAHRLTGVYSRAPVGWNTQIGFEPGINFAVREARRMAFRAPSGRALLDLIPHAGASLGNILTEAEAGVQARAGVNLSNPWWTSEWRARSHIEVYLLAGARGEAVARNITLDGNTLGPDRRVDRVPFVGEYRVGVGARFGNVLGEWRAVTRGQEYRTGPVTHTYSTMFVAYEMPVRGGR